MPREEGHKREHGGRKKRNSEERPDKIAEAVEVVEGVTPQPEEVLRSDLEFVASKVVPFLLFFGIISGGFTVSYHVTNKKWSVDERSEKQWEEAPEHE